MKKSIYLAIMLCIMLCLSTSSKPYFYKKYDKLLRSHILVFERSVMGETLIRLSMKDRKSQKNRCDIF